MDEFENSLMKYDNNKETRYNIITRLGEGVHGVVLKAIDLSNNELVAIKKIPLKTKYGTISMHAVREIKILQHSICENIVTLLDIYPDISGLALVCEYMPYTLYSKIKDEVKPLERDEIKSYSKMMFRGLEYLHNLQIMHRDIKPANLLINEKGLLKIADFGLSRLYSMESDKLYSPQIASRWYRAPEILWGSQCYGPGVDIWAAGCVYAEMLRGEPLFQGSTDIEQLALVVRTLGTPNYEEWPELKQLPDYNKIRFPDSKGEPWDRLFPASTTKYEMSLVDNLVKSNPNARLTASEALCHKYFRESNDDRK